MQLLYINCIVTIKIMTEKERSKLFAKERVFAKESKKLIKNIQNAINML